MVKKKRVYCSGPLFCPEEILVMEEIAGVLEASGYETFLPHRDGLEAFMMSSVGTRLGNILAVLPGTDFVLKAGFALDIYQVVEGCDYFVFNINGPLPDEGGVVETAAAFAHGKPIIIYRSDRRSPAGGCYHHMILGASTDFSVVDRIEDIPGRLAYAAERADVRETDLYGKRSVVPAVSEVLDLGRKVWGVVRVLGFMRPKNRMAP